MGKKIPVEIIQQIPILYEKYKNKNEVARQLGISASTVNKYLTVVAAAPIERKKKRTVVTQEIIDRINELYPKLKTLKKVSDEVGVSESTVRKYLSDDNIEFMRNKKEDYEALWYYIVRLFGPHDEEKNQGVSAHNLEQMKRFNNNGMPYKGQLLTLMYAYEVKKMDIKKANKSIGIVSYLFTEAENYYKNLEKTQKEIGEMIHRQLEKDRIEITYKPDYKPKYSKKKKEIDLDSIV